MIELIVNVIKVLMNSLIKESIMYFFLNRVKILEIYSCLNIGTFVVIARRIVIKMKPNAVI